MGQQKGVRDTREGKRDTSNALSTPIQSRAGLRKERIGWSDAEAETSFGRDTPVEPEGAKTHGNDPDVVEIRRRGDCGAPEVGAKPVRRKAQEKIPGFALNLPWGESLRWLNRGRRKK